MLLLRDLTKQRSFQRMRTHSFERTWSNHLRLVKHLTTSSSFMPSKIGNFRQYVASFPAVELKDSVSKVCVLKSRISPSRYVVMEEVRVKEDDVSFVELERMDGWECGCEGTL